MSGDAAADRLARIHAYLRGQQPLPIIPAGVPNEVRRLAEMSRVNVLDLVISAVAPSLYVDGYRAEREPDDAPSWSVWQANQMDARQTGVHRGALAYGVSYVTVLPGDTAPVLGGYSPRRMTTLYGENDLWPMFALRAEPSGKEWLYRLYDDEAVYYLSGSDRPDGEVLWLETRTHDLGVCPVVRFQNTMELDDEVRGEIEPLMPIQDQIDLTTFELLVAQHYGAFRQRYILGWTAESEAQQLKASAARLAVIGERRAVSASLAASYFESFRRAEGIAGIARPVLAGFDADAVARARTSLQVTGYVTTERLRTLKNPNPARTALVRVSGAVTRHTLDGGRETLQASVRGDRRAIGWARAPSGSACSFCAMLASRGPVYERWTGDFEAHDHCACSLEPVHRRDQEWPAGSREYQRVWRETTRRLGGTDARRAFRQALSDRDQSG